jgi:hypothetical protein
VGFKNNSAQKPQKVDKSGNEKLELYIVCSFKETKARFLFHKNFCDPFVLWNIPIFGIVVLSFD